MSALKPIAVASLAEEAFEKLTQAISTGEFLPGEKLSEANLSRQLAISRGTLREALGRLEGRLVSRTPRVGFRVIELSSQDVVELFTVREALEGMACRLAAERITDREIRTLRDLLDRHSNDKKVLGPKGYYQRSLDEDFHALIVRYAGQRRLEQMLMEQLYFQLRLHRFQSSERPGRADQAFQEHRAILEALATRDPDKAEAAMRQHVRKALAQTLLPAEGIQDPARIVTKTLAQRRR